jgi:hypothetical protein
MRRLIRLGLAVGAAITSLAFTGSAWAAYAPSLTATSFSNKPGAATTILLGHFQSDTDDPTAKDTIYVPQGYGVNLTAPVGTKIGDVSGTVILRSGGNAKVAINPADSHIFADNPALYTAQAAQCTGVATHEAVWRLDVVIAGSPLHVPLYVDHVTTGPEAAFASAKIQLCLAGPIGTPVGAQLLEALFDVNGIFTNPSTAADRIWRGVFTPYTPGTPNPNPAGTVEGQAVVPGKVSLTATVKSLKHGRIIISGRLLVDNLIVRGATVEFYVGNKKVGQVKTNATGRFTFRKKIKKKTRFTLETIGVAELSSCPAPPIPGVPQGCKTATLSFFAQKNVTARRRK